MQLVATEGPWKQGINSVDNPCDLVPGQYQWAVNTINKGGLVATRPGARSVLPAAGIGYGVAMDAITIFTARDGISSIVMAVGNQIQFIKYPFTSAVELLNLSSANPLSMQSATVQFETAVIGVTEAADGTITAIDPYPVLMICDGIGRTAFWDGAATVRLLDPGDDETPTATWMKWIGNRLWTAKGRKIRVGNLLNPLKFTEENVLSEGGYFNLPGDCTGLGVTTNFNSLLAFTDYTTTSFQAGILNRATWASTPDFQKVVFNNIGCAAGRSIVNQYGMTWWYSYGGLMNLDSALQTYRSSEIKFKDQVMRRSRANFADDISGICATAFENYLLISVPSGDLHNYHTWVMDGNPVESAESTAVWSAIWTGFRPTQWATGVIKGKVRCFCSALDMGFPEYVAPWIYGNAWEVFLQDRRDIGYNSSIVQTAKDIRGGMETRCFPTNILCEIKYVELDLEEIVGTVQLDIYYATRRGTYKRFGTKQIVGTVGSVISTMTLPVTLASYLPQKRIVKSVNESLLSTDANPAVETPQTRNIDKYFSFLIKWTGQMSLGRLKVYADVVSDTMEGVAEESETKDRYIRPDGTGAILTTGPTALPITAQQSGFLSTITPRWVEEIYQSLT